MRDIFPLIFVLAVAAAVVIGMSALLSATQRLNLLRDIYQQLATLYQGRVIAGNSFRGPQASFVYRGAQVWVMAERRRRGKRRVNYTQFQIAWPNRDTRCEVYPDNPIRRLGRFLGMQDLEIGSPKFDRDFVITGSDLASIRRLLSGPVQDRITALRGFSALGEIYVRFSPGELLVKSRGMITEFSALRQFTQLGLQLFDEALAAEAEGIEFVETQTGKLLEDAPICQICGEGIRDQQVKCRTCRTPHHRDCWEYYGACSTYGCGERRFMVFARRNS